jgi:VanZ family protein
MTVRRLWPAIIWAVFILVVTGMPGKYIPRVTTFWEQLSPDKIVHLGVFAILSFLILHGLLKQYLVSNHRYLFVAGAVGFSLVYGLVIEVLQAHVFIGRHGNAYDFYADAIGAFCGWMVFSMIYQKKIKTFSNTNQD